MMLDRQKHKIFKNCTLNILIGSKFVEMGKISHHFEQCYVVVFDLNTGDNKNVRKKQSKILSILLRLQLL